jgi:hypothetical protein
MARPFWIQSNAYSVSPIPSRAFAGCMNDSLAHALKNCLNAGKATCGPGFRMDGACNGTALVDTVGCIQVYACMICHVIMLRSPLAANVCVYCKSLSSPLPWGRCCLMAKDHWYMCMCSCLCISMYLYIYIYIHTYIQSLCVSLCVRVCVYFLLVCDFEFFLQCPEGSFSQFGNTTSCIKCPQGTYSRAGSSVCSACPYGKFSEAGSSTCLSCDSWQCSKGQYRSVSLFEIQAACA